MKGWMGRRRFLLAASGGTLAIVGCGAAVSLYHSDYPLRRWIARIVRDHLPGVAISDAALDAYAEDVLGEATSQRALTRLAAIAALVAPGVHRTNDSQKRRFDDFERYIVSGFLLRSTFFEVDNPYENDIAYLGWAACSNPFARFH